MNRNLLIKLDFHISKMDCPSEEMMIRQALSAISNQLPIPLDYDFDLVQRNLSVYGLYQESMVEKIIETLNKLKLGSTIKKEHFFCYYHIQKMDCPSEQYVIEQSLSSLDYLEHLAFDLVEHKLLIIFNHVHKADISSLHQDITNQLDSLELASHPVAFDESVIESLLNNTRLENKKSNSSACIDSCQCPEAQLTPKLSKQQQQEKQRILLWQVLIINAVFFLVEMTTGLISSSMGLVADSLDMLADSMVYGMALLAVGSTALQQKKVAKLAGWLQIGLAVLGLVEVIRRFIGLQSLPNVTTMIIISTLALVANGMCLYLLNQSKSEQAHVRASQIFTSNDIIINLGVILSAIFVWWLDSPIPDLLIGCLVFVIVFNGARRILKL